MNPSTDVFYQPLGCDINTAGVWNCRPRNAADYATENGVIGWDGSGPFVRLPSSAEGEWEKIVRLEQITEPVFDIGGGRFPWQRYQRASSLYSHFPSVSEQTRAWMMAVWQQMAGIPGAIGPDNFAADVAAEHMAQYGEHYTIASNVELTRYTVLDRLLNQPAVVNYRGGRFEVLSLPEVQTAIANGSGQAAQREQAAADSYDFLAEFGPWFMALIPIGAALVTAIGAGIGAGATAATEVSSVASSGAEIGAGAGAFESAGAIGADAGVQVIALPPTEPISVFALPADVAMTTPVAQLEFLGTVGGSPTPFYDVSSAVSELPSGFEVWPSATGDIASAVQEWSRAFQSPSSGGDSLITSQTSTYQAPSAIGESSSTVSSGSATSATGGGASASLPGFQSVIGGASATLGVAQLIRNLIGPSPLTDRAGAPATGPGAFTTPRTNAPVASGGILETLGNPWIMAGIGGMLLLALSQRKKV